MHFDIQEVISAFVVLFAVIDITGLVPIIIDLKEKGNEINAGKAAFYSLFSFYPIPTHSIHNFIALASTTAASPLYAPNTIMSTPRAGSTICVIRL